MVSSRGLAAQRASGLLRPGRGQVCLAALGLLFFAPLIGLITLFLRIAGEAAFTAQPYPRDDGSAPKVWQFRIEGLLAMPAGENPDSARHWLRTRVGRWLYLSRLDLLPMLYNVCRGDITLPEMLDEILR